MIGSASSPGFSCTMQGLERGGGGGGGFMAEGTISRQMEWTWKGSTQAANGHAVVLSNGD